MEPLPSLNALKAFEAVARYLSFTKAADELCVTQGAVSRQVKNLEDELGVALFFRIPNNLMLTLDGENLFRSTHSAFHQIRDAQRMIREKSLQLKIITAPTFATRWLIPRLYSFQEKNPVLRIQLETSVKKFDFRHHTNFDAAIIYGKPDEDHDLCMDHLFQEQLYPVCSPKLSTAARPLKSIEDLCWHCLLHSSLDRFEWRAWAKMMGITDLKNKGDQCFELEESTIQATKLGSGVSLANIYYIQDEISSGKLVFPFPEVSCLLLNSYYLVYQKNKFALHSLKKFRKWLVDEVNLFLKSEKEKKKSYPF